MRLSLESKRLVQEMEADIHFQEFEKKRKVGKLRMSVLHNVLTNLHMHAKAFSIAKVKESGKTKRSVDDVGFRSYFIPLQMKKDIGHCDIIKPSESSNCIVNHYEKQDATVTYRPQIVYMVHRYVFLFHKFFANKIACQQCHVNVYFSESKKEISVQNQAHSLHPIHPEHVNSGYAIQGNCYSINLFRLEELYKVCLHECLHATGIDLRDASPHQSTEYFVRQFRIETQIPVYINEAFVEAFATCLNCCFVTCLLKEDVTCCLHFLQLESYFAIAQTCKLLTRSGFHCYEDFIHDNDNHTNHLLRQTTSAFSYYFLKAALLIDIDWCIANFLDQNAPNVTHSSLFRKLIDNIHSSIFIACMDQGMKMENEMMRHKSLRMTCIEIFG